MALMKDRSIAERISAIEIQCFCPANTALAVFTLAYESNKITLHNIAGCERRLHHANAFTGEDSSRRV